MLPEQVTTLFIENSKQPNGILSVETTTTSPLETTFNPCYIPKLCFQNCDITYDENGCFTGCTCVRNRYFIKSVVS
jgi:hypothetical protein